MLFEAGCDGSEVLELVEEALDKVAVAVEEATEHRDVDAPGQGLDVGPSAPFGEFGSKPIAVLGAIRQEDLTRADVA